MKKFILRDLFLAALVLALIVIGLGNTNMQILSGLGIGLVIYLLHESSHYLGAVLTGATLKRASALYSPFLFSFDSKANSLKQYMDMSWPGFASTFSCLLILYLYRPDTIWSEVAWFAALALSAFTLLVEGPLFLWAIIRREIPPVEIPLIDTNPVARSLIKKLQGRTH